MLRRLSCTLLVALVPVSAQIWPERWREHQRLKAEAIEPPDAALFDECGGQAAERAVYTGPAGRFTATAMRLADSTAGLAWFQAHRPANATPLRGQALASTTPGEMYVAYQNYFLQFEGWRPTAAEFNELWTKLPALRSGGGLPYLAGYLPEKNRVRNSERYILGPGSLARFEPRVPVILAGFEHGGEAQLARFRTSNGDQTLLLFNYPTPTIARRQLKQFENQAGWVARRSGSYVGIVPDAPSRPEAEALLAGINYSQNFIWNEGTKALPPPNVVGMLLAIFQLTGLVLLVCLGGGIFLASLWVFLRHRATRFSGTGATMITLNLDDR